MQFRKYKPLHQKVTEELLQYLKDRKEEYNDFSGCGSRYEADVQHGQREAVEDTLDYLEILLHI